MELTSLLVTGLLSRLRYVSFEKPCSASRSDNSLRLLLVRTSVCRFGVLFDMDSEMLDMRFCAHKRACSRGDSGKLPSEVMLLSVKSMHSWSFATPKFSMLGILCP